MSFDLGDILAEQGDVPASQLLSREEFIEQKKVEREMLTQMRGLAVDKAFSGREHLLQYLDAQALLSNMSAGNTLLILSQRPDATDVRTFDAWKAANRSVKTGETGLLIFAPHEYESRDDGATRTGYGVVRRFDLSQTHGEPITPEPAVPFDPVQRLRALIAAPPAPIVMDSGDRVKRGVMYDVNERVIFVREGLDAGDAFRALTIAIAQASFQSAAWHEGTPFAAECAAYIACKRVGMENLGGFALDPASIGKADRLLTLDDAAVMAKSLVNRMNRQITQRAQSAPSR